MRNLALIFFGLTFFLCRPASAEINIAIITPEDGKYESLGKELVEGVRIAVDNINSKGGLRGEKLSFIQIEDPCDDILSVSTAQMLAVSNSKTDRFSLVIGPYCSNSFDEVAETFAKAGIFQIISTTMGVDNHKQNHKGLVKLAGTKERQGKDFYNFYKSNFPDRMVAVVYDSNDKDIVDIAAAVQAEFLRDKASDSLKSFDYNAYKNMSKLSKAVLSSGARVGYILGSPNEIEDLFRELKEHNKNFVIFTNKYQLNDAYKTKLGSLTDDSYMIALPSLKDNPAFTEELVKLRLLGIEPEGLSVYSYSAIKLWEELVNKTKSFDYNKLGNALKNNKIETPWGEVMFHNGTPKTDMNYSIYRIEQTHLEKVY